MVKKFIPFALFLFLLPLNIFSQDYEISGIVTHNGEPAADVAVYFTRIDSIYATDPPVYQTMTNENGEYLIEIEDSNYNFYMYGDLHSELCPDQFSTVYLYHDNPSVIREIYCVDNWDGETSIYSYLLNFTEKEWSFHFSTSIPVATYYWEIEGQIYSTNSCTHSFSQAGTHEVTLTIESENGNTYSSSTIVAVAETTLVPITIEGVVKVDGLPMADVSVYFEAGISSAFVENTQETTTDASGHYSFENQFYLEFPVPSDTILFSIGTAVCPYEWTPNTTIDEDNLNIVADISCGNESEYAINIAATPINEQEMQWYFEAYSSFEFTSFVWNINGETFYTNPVNYQFSTPGTYEISVSGVTAYGYFLPATLEINVGSDYSANCYPYFFPVADSTGTYPDYYYYFINTSLGTNLSYFWDFGDGNTSTEAYPHHTYEESDQTYEVCLTITGDDDCEETYCMSINSGMFEKPSSHNSKELSGLAKSDGFEFIVVPVASTMVGVENFEITEFSIHPNPATDIINISFSGNHSESGYLSAMDITGKVVEKVSIKNTNQTISMNVKHLPSGVYLIQFQGKHLSKTQKMVKR